MVIFLFWLSSKFGQMSLIPLWFSPPDHEFTILRNRIAQKSLITSGKCKSICGETGFLPYKVNKSIHPTLYRLQYLCLSPLSPLPSIIFCRCFNSTLSYLLFMIVLHALLPVYVCVCMCVCWININLSPGSSV